MTNALDLAAIRMHHTLLLLRLLWQKDLARIELSRIVGLSRSAVSSIVAELLSVGLVLEVGPQSNRKGAGRKATLLTLNAPAVKLVGVDLGARHLRVALLDLHCRVIDSQEIQHDIETGPGATYRRIEDLTRALLERNDVPLAQIAMIGIGIPGPVEHHTGCVINPPNMPGWDGENVARALSETFQLPVHADNDANLGALAEYRFGRQHGSANLIYLKVAKGIGAGILLDGKLYRGARGGAGEIGHISINEMGPRGRSGNPGSLESYASADVILARARSLAQKRGDTELTASSSLSDLLHLADRDPLAREIMHDTGRYLGIAITTVLNLFNPSSVVVGGQLSQAGEPLLDAVRDVIGKRALQISRDEIEVTLSTLGPDIGVIGAGAMLLDQLFTPTGLPRLYDVASGWSWTGGAERAPPSTAKDSRSFPTHFSLPGGTA